MIGTTLLDRYQIESELGRGGMGIVYKAHDTLLNRIVAIKFLNTSGVGTEGKARLLQEARATAQLNHPNIVSVFDAGETEGNPFIVMEFVQGNTLRQTPTPSISDALIMAAQICKALDHAHSKGIIHRDLKLENIILTDTQTLKLMDFGLARSSDDVRQSEEGMLTGTLAYLAPELIQGQAASVQSDLYAFGVILYELLVGHAPFQGTINTVLAQHMQGKVTPPSKIDAQIPAWVDELVLRLLSKRPEERPASAKDVLLVLEQNSATPLISISPGRSRNNLPSNLSKFIGREKEIAEVKEALSEYRLVTLTGSGGVGKTRLSLQVATELLDQFPNGTWFVELAPITDPDLIPQIILTAADMQTQQGRSALDSLTDFLCEKTSLLVLDNCEHLIEACAKLADTLLNAAPNFKILTSSREALGVKGEQAWHVPSLSIPDLKHLPATEQLSQYESVRLFIDRALLVQPHFAVTNENANAVAQICSRLDGIPLAIELAAARIRMLSAEEIAVRLDDRFRLLTGGSRTALPRQQTLRALIDWSYDLLSENERTLLRRLVVFSNNCTLEAAEQICSDDNISSYDIMDLLTHLVDKSLVALEEHPVRSRYRILETVRQYSREKLLESGEGEASRKKHFDYFFKLASEAEPYIHYGVKQLIWLDRLEDELDNFHVALEWSLGNKMEQGAQLVAQLWWFWDRRGHWIQGYDWTLRALEFISGENSLHAKILAEASWLSDQLVYQQQAIIHATESVALYRALGDKAGLAVPLIILGDEFRDRAEWMKSQEFYAESYALFEETRNKWGCGCVLLNGFATFAEKNRKYDELKTIVHQALAMFREVEDKQGISYATWRLGQHALFVNELARAKEYHGEAMRLAREGKYADLLTLCMRSLGHLAYLDHDYAEAKRLFEELVQMNRDLGDKSGVAYTLRRIGHLARLQGDYDGALKIYAEILSKAHEIEERRPIFGTLLEIAFVNERTGWFARAVKLFGAVETLYPILYEGMVQDFHNECNRTKDSCRKNLSESSFNAAYAEGKAMTYEQVIAYALDEIQ